MQGYWKSDSLKFYGSRGLTYGWENTLNNYKKGYPTKAESGTLNFVINDISKIEGDNYWVMGEYHLKREVGNADGVFIIIFKKINGEWKITHYALTMLVPNSIAEDVGSQTQEADKQ